MTVAEVFSPSAVGVKNPNRGPLNGSLTPYLDRGSDLLGLKECTLSDLRSFFHSQGHFPSDAMWDGIDDLLRVLIAMAEGTCERRYHLSSLDPGVGKSSAIRFFIRNLINSASYMEVGALICVSRLDEIIRFVADAGIDRSCLGVYTSDDEVNQLGGTDCGSARVLLTTQQMVESRCRERRFSDLTELHFEGRPRQVRVWDETMMPAVTVTLSTDQVHQLIPAFRKVHPGVSDCLDGLLDRAKAAHDGAWVEVPDVESPFGLDLGRMRLAVRGCGSTVQDAARALWFLSGKQVTVRRDRPNVNTILSYEDIFTDDITPILITDASGRVRSTYADWRRGRGNLVFLRQAPKRYDSLTIHLWDRGGGKASFREAPQDIASAIARTINKKPNEEWLVVHHKDTPRFGLPSAVQSRLEGPCDRVHFVSWGNHSATNDYAHVKNVLLAGTLFFPPSEYEALGRASAGLDDTERLTRRALREIELGEHRHLILQALCRGAVRTCEGDQCGPCDAYIIASHRTGIPGELERIFPGCNVVPWKPVSTQLTGNLGASLRYLVDRFDIDPDVVVPYREVMDEIAMRDTRNFRRMRGDQRFKEAMIAQRIEDSRTLKGFVFDNPKSSLAFLEEEAARVGDF